MHKTVIFIMHSFKNIISIAFLPAALLACSPNFNWREIHENNYIIAFPSKPSNHQKIIIIDNKKYILNLQASSSGDSNVLFGVGYIQHDNSKVSQLEKDLQKQWCKSGELIRYYNPEILVCKWSNGGNHKILQSKWIYNDKYIYQLSVIYDKSYFDKLKDKQNLQDNIDLFFSSFKLIS